MTVLMWRIECWTRLIIGGRRRWWWRFMFLFGCGSFGMWTTMVTGNTAYRWNGVLFVFFIMEEFFIDAVCHAHHIAGNIFFPFFIACKIKFLGILFLCNMAEITFYAQ